MKPLLLTSVLLTLAAPALADSANQCIDVAGMGNYNYAADGKSGVAAMVGGIAGGVSFKQTSDFVSVGDKGRSEATFTHMFVTEDGSTIRTEDRSWGYAVADTPYIAGGAAYTVVEATGRFEGYRGTFNSWGTFAPSKGKAVLRYEGKICKAKS